MTTELEIRATGYDVSFGIDGDPRAVFPVTTTEETATRTILRPLVDAFAVETGAMCDVRKAGEPEDRPARPARIL